tara:strand:+ start:407 stop:922 length:516 start_codon:yes stop_codon:yes gene_type:complete
MIDLGQIKIINNLTAEAVIKRLKSQLSSVRPGSKRGKPMNNWESLSNSLNPEGGEGYFSEVIIKGNDYGVYLDEGIDNVPFERGSGASHSAYITALQFWAVKKFGVNMVRAKQLAFAIASTQKKSNQAPDDKGWIDEVQSELERIIFEEYSKNTYFVIEREVNQILNIRIP